MTTKIRSFLIKYALGLCVAIVLLGCAKPAEKILSRSRVLMDEGKYLEAANLLKELTVLYPNNAQVWNQLGVAYHHYGDLVAATHAYTSALKLSNNFSTAHYNLGCALFEMRNYLQASREFATYVMYEPQSVDGWIKLGSTQLYLGQYDAAEKSFKAALSLNPQSYEAYNGLGISAIYQKRWRDSIQHFSNALKIKPDYPPATLNMAVLLLNYQKDKDNAIKMFRRYLSIKSQSPYHSTISNLLSKLESPPTPIVTNKVEIPQTNVFKSPVIPEQKGVTSAPPVGARPTQPQLTNVSEKTAPPSQPVIKEVAKPQVFQESLSKTSMIETTLSQQPISREKTETIEIKPAVSHTAQTSVVKVQREPELVIVPVSNPPQVSVVSPESQSAGETIKISEPAVTKSEVDVKTNIATKQEKTGFARNLLNKINPFRKKTTAEPPITPLPSDSKETLTSQAGQVGTQPNTGTKKSEISKPSESSKEIARVETSRFESKIVPEKAPEYPRYKYKNPAKPIQGNVEEAQKQFKLGLEDHEAGNLIEAKVHYSEAIKINPAFYEATYNLALICFQHNEIERALELYEKALAINPDAPNARLNFAIALQKANYLFDAVNEYEKYLKINTNDARVHLLLGNLYAQQLKDKNKAASHYMEVLRIEPTHPQALAIHQWLKQNAQ